MGSSVKQYLSRLWLVEQQDPARVALILQSLFVHSSIINCESKSGLTFCWGQWGKKSINSTLKQFSKQITIYKFCKCGATAVHYGSGF